MSALDRVVAGLSCRDVLHRLSPFLDGELPATEVRQVEAHLAECDTCARFGGHVGAMVQQLRGSLEYGPVPDAAIGQRVMARVAEINRS